MCKIYVHAVSRHHKSTANLTQIFFIAFKSSFFGAYFCLLKDLCSRKAQLNIYQSLLSGYMIQCNNLQSFVAVQLALIFSHTEKYPDEPPRLNVKSLRGIKQEDLKSLKENLEQEASENLGMAMIYTLVTSAKDWLVEKFSHDAEDEEPKEKDAVKDDIIIPHGEPVTVETFLAWRERFEAELALERAKLMPESELAPKEKKLTGRQWFESGRATVKGSAPVTEGTDDEDEEEDIDFEDDFEDDEEDMLEHYLAEKSDTSSHGSSRK
eukprot:TRINITY_DN2510_c0_g1_i2.p1 TRINITY_DN2510_c0_g1~~TRINITY_DN2510_c0_g1_i2.p1  ORF type:complete len:267 (-),score=53.11 TRINITY_DN2510_c0_g1_i2:353-1153(-)